MTNQKETSGSNRSMRRALMGGAVVSSLVIASLTPASAGCLSPQVRINAQIINYSNTPTKQLGVNWNGASNQQNTNFGWAPTDDLRVRGQYNYGRQLSPEPQINRGGGAPFGGSSRTAIRYDTPRFGAVRIRPEIAETPVTGSQYRGRSDDNLQVALRYAGEFGGIRVRAVNTNQAARTERVNVVRFQRIGDYRIPNVTVRGETITSFRGTPRIGERELIMRVTPSYRPNSER